MDERKRSVGFPESRLLPYITTILEKLKDSSEVERKLIKMEINSSNCYQK